MKTIGIIGGLTWYSTLDYYRMLNEGVNKKLGGAHAAKIILNSVDFAEIKILTERQDWERISVIICEAARVVEAAGAACLMIGANTMHQIADNVQAVINIPLIHIADAVATEIKTKKLKTVALLGTKYTMQLDFYKNKLLSHGISTIIPSDTDIEFINNSIYAEFSNGIFLPETKKEYLLIIDKMKGLGAEAVILGCTEIPILIKQIDSELPLFDSAYLHSLAAVEFVLHD